jgi:dihydroxyacetone kinase-like protein
VRVEEPLRRRILQAMAEAIEQEAEALSALDAAAGDGDHGHNMRRGFQAALEQREAIVAKPLGAAAQELGRTLVMTVGGASGAIFGTAFMAAGRALPEDVSRLDAAAALRAAAEAVQARGKAQPGHKTMLDVLLPVADALRDGSADVAAVADRAAEATAGMQAVRGRAASLGERSLGHVDAGARSASVILGAIAGVIAEATAGATAGAIAKDAG